VPTEPDHPGGRYHGAVSRPPAAPRDTVTDRVDDWVALTDEPLPLQEMVAWATTPRSGAVVSFLGVVRDHAEGRAGVEAITYEAYREQAARVLTEVVADARRRWPAVARVSVVHRVGRVALGEASVAVVVSAPHRAEAFAAARHCIDTLKETVPIWKQEHWAGGSDWAVDERPLRRVDERVAPPTRSGG
jgi:molybdopterin synthase catalytic subunit